MDEWVVGQVVEKIVDTGFEYLKDQVRWQTGMKEELQRLQEIYPVIQRVVAASSQERIRDQNPALDRWLWQLRDAVDEADDLLDEFEYLKLKEQLTRNTEETKGKKLSITSLFIESCHKIRKVSEHALEKDRNLNRLEEVVQKLVNVSADVAKYSDLFENKKQKVQVELNDIRETGALPTNNFIGRCEEMEFIMQWLRNSSNEHQSHITSSNLHKNISLLSIVGHSGMGKTTLSRHAYDNGMTNKFDVKMWVCVSTNFDVKRVIAGMLESHKKSRCDLDTLEGLQLRLKSEVDSKKFLLVLDDIREDEEKEKNKIKWKNVFASLAYGSLGSKILVTTRTESVALMIANVLSSNDHTILRLGGMKVDECLQLLNYYEFATVENPDAHKKLRFITREIVKKLSGSPLAAKVIGGVLNYNLNERHWIRVLNSDIRSAEVSQNNIMPILRLSYTFLPKPLQTCFTFCGIFPQDHKFDKNDLIRMWISLGFIQTSSIPGETMEDIGGRYFDILVKKSFFDMCERDGEIYYTVHDLLHELARLISAHECFQFVGNKEIPFKIPKTTRHLFIENFNLKSLKQIKKLKNLHSLFLTYWREDQDFVDALTDVFRASKNIRLLSIDYVKVVPETIGYLTHLRYLKCSYTDVTHLPRSLSSLYHLQFIIFRPNFVKKNENFLPRDMNNLTNLYDSRLTCKKFPRIYEIGKLISLQELNWFYVKNEVGYSIGELEHMNELRQLRIILLENVKDAEEACNAKLYDKRNLINLSLEWGDIVDIDGGPQQYKKRGAFRNIVDPYIDEGLIDNLRPHISLKKLSIYSFMGTRSAIWMNYVNLISNLEYIKLNDCFEWQTLPPFGQLPFLKFLYLKKMPSVKRLDNKHCFFPALEVLRIKKLEALEVWFDEAAAADDCLFPCLAELHLKDCPNLKEPPTLPPELKELKIDNIGWKSFICLQSISNLCSISIKNCSNQITLRGHEEVDKSENIQPMASNLVVKDPSVLLMEPLRSITSLEKLTIEHNDELVSFPIEAEQWFLQVSSSLRELNFKWLITLHSIPSFLTSLSSLMILKLEHVPQLRLLSDIPASLERLELSHLRSLQCLPSSLSISSLSYLSLTYVSVQKLPFLPPSLCVLKLDHLEYLDCLPSLSSLQMLFIRKVSQLRKLPDLPPSLRILALEDLKNLDCLPSCPFDLSSIQEIFIDNVPRLRKLPDLPPSLEKLSVYNCHPELMECYRRW